MPPGNHLILQPSWPKGCCVCDVCPVYDKRFSGALKNGSRERCDMGSLAPKLQPRHLSSEFEFGSPHVRGSLLPCKAADHLHQHHKPHRATGLPTS